MIKVDWINKEDTTILGHRLLVRIRKAEEKTKSGIIIPEEIRNKEHFDSFVGQVIKVGASCYKDKQFYGVEPWVEVGDWVIFPPVSGIKITDGNEVYRVMHDNTPLISFKERPTEDWVHAKDMKVLGHRLLVKGDKAKEKTAGGVYLHQESIDVSKFNACIGQVISMGDGCYKDRLFAGSEPWVSIGEWIAYPRNEKTRIPTQEDDYLIMDDNVPLLSFDEKPEGVSYSW